MYLSTTNAYIHRGECAKAVAVNLVAAAVHPSAYDNRRTRSCPKINVQLCKRNESPFKADHDIAHTFTPIPRIKANYIETILCYSLDVLV